MKVKVVFSSSLTINILRAASPECFSLTQSWLGFYSLKSLKSILTRETHLNCLQHSRTRTHFIIVNFSLPGPFSGWGGGRTSVRRSAGHLTLPGAGAGYVDVVLSIILKINSFIWIITDCTTSRGLNQCILRWAKLRTSMKVYQRLNLI